MRRISADDLIAWKASSLVLSPKHLILVAAAAGLMAFLPVSIAAPWHVQLAQAGDDKTAPSSADQYEPDDSSSKNNNKQDDNANQQQDDASPPADDNNDQQQDDTSKQQDDASPPANDNNDQQQDDANQQQADNTEIEPLNPGEAVVTRFSHEVDGKGVDGKPIKVIDLDGTSVSILDIRNPGQPPFGQHWINEPQRMFVTARDVGQVFGVAIAQKEGQDPVIFLSATAAYGLHRIATDPKNTDWMEGQWGPDEGPGTIYRLSADNGYKAEAFAEVKLDGRDNTGASLGNIAYDKWHGRLFVSDLETGMIHSFDAETGKDMGHYDHGMTGRTNFLDAWTGQHMALDPVAFDPTTSANIDKCGSDFEKSPQCWNLADFRRRVWGLKVRSDESGAVRLYYSVWGSDAFGNTAWPKAGDDRRNAVWSVVITGDGLFDTSSVRREFFMPAFWPSDPSFGEKAGNSNAPSDITLPECATQNVMLVAERGGMRNLGLDKIEPFARPYQSRVVRYELGADNLWRPKGRYDVGFHDRSIKDGEPLLFANAAGGVDFDYRISENGSLDLSAPSQSVWMTGDGLCSPLGGCNDDDKGSGSDTHEVHGLQGTPADAFVAVEPAPKLDPGALLRSLMIDTDINIDDNGNPIPEEMTRNDATKIGDVAIYQVCQAVEPLPAIDVPSDDGQPPSNEPPVGQPPVHTVDMSHAKWASSGHRVQRSWHWRLGSWHDADRSWHYRDGSWHDRDRSWHWRDGSWHQVDRSWHYRNGSWHDRDRSWHWRDGSWHEADRSWHMRDGSWHDRDRSWHQKTRSYHTRDRSWGGDDHPNHDKRLSMHVKGQSWGGDVLPRHDTRLSAHVKGRSFGNNNRPQHIKGRTWAGEVPQQHNKRLSDINHTPRPTHLKSISRADNMPTHSRRLSFMQHNPRPRHLRSESLHGGDMRPHHSRRDSFGMQRFHGQRFNNPWPHRNDNGFRRQRFHNQNPHDNNGWSRRQRFNNGFPHNNDGQFRHNRRMSMFE